MNRPYVICHMLSSIDGKVTGKFLNDDRCKSSIEVYYKIHRESDIKSFACGRVTMEESFTKGFYPDLSTYSDELKERKDYISHNYDDRFAIAFDRKGKLGWKANRIFDEDEGYNNFAIIEVLTQQVDERYLRYLESLEISYIFAGDIDIDVNLALKKLYYYFGINKLLLEGGSIINGAFLNSNAIDELSLVVAPINANQTDKPIFYKSNINDYKLVGHKVINDTICCKYLINYEKFIPLKGNLKDQINQYIAIKNKIDYSENVSSQYSDYNVGNLFHEYPFDFSKININVDEDSTSYIDIGKHNILNPMLINVLLHVLNKPSSFLNMIFNGEYTLFISKQDHNKKVLLTKQEISNKEDEFNKDDYDCLKYNDIIYSLLEDVDFSSEEEIISYLRMYNITKKDFLLDKLIIFNGVLNNNKNILAKQIYKKIIVRNIRLMGFLNLNAPEEYLEKERELVQKAVNELYVELFSR